MSDTTDFDIVGGYNKQRFDVFDAQRTVNMFVDIDPMGKKPKCLVHTSGLKDPNIPIIGTAGGFRRQFSFKNVMYSVVGPSLYRMEVGGPQVKVGVFERTITGHVGVDANQSQILFVDGQDGYIWNTIDSSFNKITDAAFPRFPIDCCYLDGFFVVINGNSNNFQLSSFENGMTWGPAENLVTSNNPTLPDQLIVGNSTLTGGLAGTNNYRTGTQVQLVIGAGGALPTGLSVATTYYTIYVDSTHVKLAASYRDALLNIPVTFTGNITPIVTILSDGQLQQGSITSHPGNLVACRTLHRRLFLFSEYFTETWTNAGASTNLPFRRDNSMLIEQGTPAISSVAAGFDSLFFLSQDRDGFGSVIEIAGTQPIPISTKALDYNLAQLAEKQQVSDCLGFLVKENGLIFYRLNFTAANHTYVYNVSMSNPQSDASKYWHEEETLAGDRHPAQTHVYFNGINYVGDYQKPQLYILDNDTYTNNGELIRRMRITRSITPPGYQRLRVDKLQLDLLQGNVANLLYEYSDIGLLVNDEGFFLTTDDGSVILLDQQSKVNREEELYVFMSISKDGGQSWGYRNKARMGKVGQRTFRTVWRKLGSTKRGQGFVMKIEFFDPVPFVILGASWAYEIGKS